MTDDVLVKAFALGPDASISPHEHEGATNVFHVLQGTVTVERDAETETVSAPGVVLNERGQVHGASVRFLASNHASSGANVSASTSDSRIAFPVTAVVIPASPARTANQIGT